MASRKQGPNRRKILGVAGAAVAMSLLPEAVDARGLRSAPPHPGRLPAPSSEAPSGGTPSPTTSTCGPAVAITVPYATGITGSPSTGVHTHVFAVTLVKGTLQDGNTVRVLGATSGPLQQFPLHIHIINSTGVLGQPCSFMTEHGEHAFTLSAADFVVP